MRETRFSVAAQGDHPAGDPHGGLGRLQRGRVGTRIFLNDFRRRGGRVKFMGIGLISPAFDLGKFFLALLELIGWLEW